MNFPHESLSPVQAEALTVLAEECAELAIEATKILRYGAEFQRRGGQLPPNRRLFTQELMDVCLLMAICEHLGLSDPGVSSVDYTQGKVQRLKDWSGLGEVAQEVMA